jgi:DNA (cytosine-5)-methyltransferase 1
MQFESALRSPPRFAIHLTTLANAPTSEARSPAPVLDRPPVLDLFAGAGGLSIGLSAAGFEPVGAMEFVADAASTYAARHDVEVIRRDIGLLSNAELRAFRDEVRVVAGGPPCQPWSTGGLRRGDADDRDGFPEFFRALLAIEPEAFICENVAGLESGSSASYLQELLGVLRDELRYDVSHRVLNAADFGVPQHRRRLFIVGTRDRDVFRWPEATHGPDAARPWRTAGEVLTPDAAGESNTSIVTYAKKPQLRPSAYDGLLFNGGGRPIDLRVPARTILASAGGNKTPFHDTLGVVPPYHAHLRRGGAPYTGRVPGARRLTVAECAALQSFPAGMTVVGTRSSQYTQVGNAVPPLLAEAVGRAVLEALG